MTQQLSPPACPDLDRPWSVSPVAWLATLATIREHADAPTWWRVWVVIHKRRPSIPWDGGTFRDLHAAPAYLAYREPAV